MLILGHIRQIVQACHPVNREEEIELWHNIKPVKFGDRHIWALVNPQTLASYQVPEDAAFLLILKTECYTFTDTAIAAGFRQFEPPPTGTAQWTINVGAGAQGITGLVPIHLLAEASEFTLVKAGVLVSLQATLNAPPDGNQRLIRTTVYGYHISAVIADRIGSGEALTVGANT